MLRKLNLNQRFGLLILVPALILLIVGSFSAWTALVSSRHIDTLQQQQQRQHPLPALADLISTELTTITYTVTLNRLGWEPALDQLTGLHDRFESQWQRYLGTLPAGERSELENRYRTPLVELRRAFSELSRLLENRDRPQLRLFVINEFDGLIQPYLDAINRQMQQQQAATLAQYQTLQATQQGRAWISLGLAVLGVGLVVALSWVVQQSIMQPIRRIASVARSVMIGDYSVRVGFSGRDELGKLGQALDRLLDDQHDQRNKSKEERDRVQATLDILQQHVQHLEQGNLNTRVPTDDDLTRTLAQSMNRFTAGLATQWQPLSQLVEDIHQHNQAVRSSTDALAATTDLSGFGQLAELSGSLQDDLKHAAKLSHACSTVAAETQRNSGAAIEALQELIALTPDQPLEHVLQQHLEKLQTQTTAIQALTVDFSEAAEQAQMLSINGELRRNADGHYDPMSGSLKSLARALKRTQQLLIPLSERVHGAAHHVLLKVQESATHTQSAIPLLHTSQQRVQRCHEAIEKLVHTIDKISVNLYQQSSGSEQLLLHSADLQARVEHMQQALQEHLNHTATLSQYVGDLHQRVPSSGTLSADHPSADADESSQDSHAPLSMNPS